MSRNRNMSGKRNNQRKNSPDLQKGKTKRNSSRAQRRNAEIADEAAKDIRVSASNDYEWYANFAQLAEDATKISFGTPLGKNLSIKPESVPNVQEDEFIGYQAPGVMTLSFIPSYGYSTSKDSPMNRAALRFYTYMRSHLKASNSYDAADMMMVILALDNLNMLHRMLQRAYGIAQLYTPINYYYPTVLLGALGFNPDVFLDGGNLYLLRGIINNLAAKLSMYPIPKDIDIVKRHSWMTSGIYVDSQTTRAQTYAFVPEGMWIFDNTRTTGTGLKWLEFPKSTFSQNYVWNKSASQVLFNSLDDVKSTINSALAALMGDQDVGNICGDMLNAFGYDVMTSYTEISADFKVLPVYDPVVLSQIENASFVGSLKPSSLVISQDPAVNSGAILFTPQADAASAACVQEYLTSNAHLLNLHMDSPGPKEVMEATRLMAFGTKDGTITIMGTDICTVWRIHRWVALDGKFQPSYVFTGISMNEFADDSATNPKVRQVVDHSLMMATMSAFDWHPIVSSYHRGNDGFGHFGGWSFDADNIALITQTDLQQLDEVALISLFDIPELRFFIGK